MMEYLKHVRSELAHVAWPSTRTAISHTLVVILVAILVSILVGVLDYAFSGVVSQFIV